MTPTSWCHSRCFFRCYNFNSCKFIHIFKNTTFLMKGLKTYSSATLSFKTDKISASLLFFLKYILIMIWCGWSGLHAGSLRIPVCSFTVEYHSSEDKENLKIFKLWGERVKWRLYICSLSLWWSKVILPPLRHKLILYFCSDGSPVMF